MEVNSVFKDPIYGYVRIEHEIIKKLIDTKEFQRLRRIKQLSGVCMVFHMAEHNRFSHSLGTYELAREVLERVSEVRENMTAYEQIIFLCSALLHDLGHGPYSHSFEDIFGINHEQMTCRIIEGTTEVNRVLKEFDEKLPKEIVSVINHEGKYSLIEDLVSSQLDVDRMDYLRRDAYFTGAAFGEIDNEKILRGMAVRDKHLVFKASAVPNIEDYLMSRYHMYYQVYYHPVARGFEVLLEKIYARWNHLMNTDYQFNVDVSLLQRVIKNKDVISYIEIDDVYVNGCIKSFQYEEDHELQNLAKRLINRKLFNYYDARFIKSLELSKIALLKENPDYYVKEDAVSKSAYDYNPQNEIKILLPNGEIEGLVEFSPIVEAFSKSSKKVTKFIFFGKL